MKMSMSSPPAGKGLHDQADVLGAVGDLHGRRKEAGVFAGETDRLAHVGIRLAVLPGQKQPALSLEDILALDLAQLHSDILTD